MSRSSSLRSTFKTNLSKKTQKHYRGFGPAGKNMNTSSAKTWQSFKSVPAPFLLTYCWWKKSSTSWYSKYPIISRVLYVPGGCLGFLNHQPYLVVWGSKTCRQNSIASPTTCQVPLATPREQQHCWRHTWWWPLLASHAVVPSTTNFLHDLGTMSRSSHFGNLTCNPSTVEWDLTNGPLGKLLELLNSQVEGSVQLVLLKIPWIQG